MAGDGQTAKLPRRRESATYPFLKNWIRRAQLGPAIPAPPRWARRHPRQVSTLLLSGFESAVVPNGRPMQLPSKLQAPIRQLAAAPCPRANAQRWLTLAAMMVGLFAGSVAQAAPQHEDLRSADERAQDRLDEAKELFREARELLDAGDIEAACRRFEASMELDAATGTQLNLANCYRQRGQLAKAHRHFIRAAERARQDGQEERAQLIEGLAKPLANKLSFVKIVVKAPEAGIVVQRDGQPVAKALWGIPMALSPGTHHFRVSAPGKQTWLRALEVGDEPTQLVVVVPRLEQTLAPSAEPSPKADDGESSNLLAGGVATMALGTIGVGFGVAFGLLASSRQDDASAHCQADSNRCDSEGVALRDEALTAAHVATAGFAIGGAALVGGLVMVLAAPSSDEPQPKSSRLSHWQFAPWVGPQGAGLQAGGRW